MSRSSKKSMQRRPKNLLLDLDAIARGERYSELHGITLSQLVSDFLRSLPLEAERSSLSPVVRRLWGVAKSARTGREDYRQHLVEKYGTK